MSIVKSTFVGLLICFLCCMSQAFATEQPLSAELTPGEIDSTLAKLSDEQVRSLLLAELSKDVNEADTPDSPIGGSMVHKATGLLHLLDTGESDQAQSAGILATFTGIIPDFISVARTIGNGSLGGFALSVFLIGLAFGAACLVELFTRRFTASFSKQFQEKAIPDLDGPMRFVAGIMRSIPIFIHILVFGASAILLFLIIPSSDQAPVRYLFLALLLTIIFYRFIDQISRIICAPKISSLRIVPMSDSTAASLHKGFLLLCTYTFAAVMFLALLMELKLAQNSFSIMVIVAVTLLVTMIIVGIIYSRVAVKERILEESDRQQTRNWIIEQFAQFWHVPTILYFVVVWFIMVNSLLSGGEQEKSSFLLSMMVLPLFIVFNKVGQWVVFTSIKTLQIYNPDIPEDADEDTKLKLIEDKERERKITVTAGRFVRLSIIAALLIWSASLWGYHVPYVSEIAGAVFESLITLALGLTAWRFASSFIEKKMAEAAPEEEEDSDNEFGSAGQQGRGYTLLPMVKKVLASTLVVMVALIIISAFGVNIGPLLAGAGVLGLAVGFGAQKLVTDLLSGFFYLLDDAFRVGEYIQAGSASGAVEGITLRNVMLRHHRGMLQIVPHSELGSITNFMRGGLVVKFNLEFPYDTDIDKVRKIIKKVGQAMLKDEEFGKDFISPVKSQGVKEITGSVMVIRVKFTAQPGTQFVIQREAFRRITESLNSKGIYYAHRKVIVELPEDHDSGTPDKMKKAMEAGAAAELARLEEEEKKKTIAQGHK